MNYILDFKSNLASIATISSTGDVNVNGGFTVQPSGFDNPLVAVETTGNVTIGDSNSTSNIVIYANEVNKFEQLTGTDTDYQLSANDYTIEVLSNTYMSLTLPSAANIGGRTYIISRGTTSNNDLILQTQTGENIDGDPFIAFTLPHYHLTVMSNNIDTWYLL